MVVLAPWSSLTLPTGRAKPLVRGEGNPAAFGWSSDLLLGGFCAPATSPIILNGYTMGAECYRRSIGHSILSAVMAYSGVRTWRAAFPGPRSVRLMIMAYLVYARRRG